MADTQKKKNHPLGEHPVIVIVLIIILVADLLAMVILAPYKKAYNEADEQKTNAEATSDSMLEETAEVTTLETTPESGEETATATTQAAVSEKKSHTVQDDETFEVDRIHPDSLDEFLDRQVTYDEVNFDDVFDMTHAGEEEENPEQRMAHTIYSDSELSDTSGRFDSFMIDFKVDHAGTGTYWALCVFDLDTSYLEKDYKNINSGGAYCGLQTFPEGNSIMMARWDTVCDDTVLESTIVFDNSVYYTWESGKWYRMLLQCIEDEETGNTLVEMWIKDIAEDRWDIIFVLDTHMQKTCFTGGMTQEMGNLLGEYSNELRSFQYANLAVKDCLRNDWVPITQSHMLVDTWWDDKKGTFAFGSTSTNLWGIACGYGEDMAEPDSDISSWENIDG